MTFAELKKFAKENSITFFPAIKEDKLREVVKEKLAALKAPEGANGGDDQSDKQ